MAISTAALIPRVRDYLYDRSVFATQGSAASTSSVVAVTDGTDWDEGAVGEFQSDGEQFKVISVSSNNLTCFRGWNGTTAAIQAAATTIMRDPLYSYRQVSQALTGALYRLWPYAWKIVETSVTPSTTTKWNTLAATDMAFINATQRYGGSSEYEGWYVQAVYTLAWDNDSRAMPIIFQRNMDSALVTGAGVRFPSGYFHQTNSITVRTAARITGTSDIEDSGTLPVGEALVVGALASILKGAQIERIGPGVNRDQIATIGSNARLQTFGSLESEFRERLSMLHYLHQELYPIASDSGW